MSFGLIPTSTSVPFLASDFSGESGDVLPLLETNGPSVDGFAALLSQLSGTPRTPSGAFLPGTANATDTADVGETPALLPTEEDADPADLPPGLMLATFTGLNEVTSPPAGTGDVATVTEPLPVTATNALPTIDPSGNPLSVESPVGADSPNRLEAVPQTGTVPGTQSESSPAQADGIAKGDSTSVELPTAPPANGLNRTDSPAPIDAALSQPSEVASEQPVHRPAIDGPIPETSPRSTSLPAAEIEPTETLPGEVAAASTWRSQATNIVDDRANRRLPDELSTPIDTAPATMEQGVVDASIAAVTAPLFGDRMASVLKKAQSSGAPSASPVPVSARANPLVPPVEADAIDGDGEIAVPEGETSLLPAVDRPELTGIRETTVAPQNEAVSVDTLAGPLPEPVSEASPVTTTLPPLAEVREASEKPASHGVEAGVDTAGVVPVTNSTPSVAAVADVGVTSGIAETALRESVIQQVVQAALARSQVVERFSGAAFELRLSPPELGPLRVELRRSESGLSIRVAAATSETRALLDTVRGEIAQSLQSMDGSGISFDVAAGSGFSDGEASRESMFNRQPEGQPVSVQSWARHSRDRQTGPPDSPLNVLA